MLGMPSTFWLGSKGALNLLSFICVCHSLVLLFLREVTSLNLVTGHGSVQSLLGQVLSTNPDLPKVAVVIL